MSCIFGARKPSKHPKYPKAFARWPSAGLGPPTRSPCGSEYEFQPVAQQRPQSCEADIHVLPYRSQWTGEDRGRSPPTGSGSAWVHLGPRQGDLSESLNIHLGVMRRGVEKAMPEYGANLLESGTLP